MSHNRRYADYETEWDRKLIKTGLFGWFYDDGGRILKLNGQNIFVISRDLWILENEDGDPYLAGTFENVLDSVEDKETQANLLFHLDLFV